MKELEYTEYTIIVINYIKINNDFLGGLFLLNSPSDNFNYSLPEKHENRNCLPLGGPKGCGMLPWEKAVFKSFRILLE